jgi:hypothetical protein
MKISVLLTPNEISEFFADFSGYETEIFAKTNITIKNLRVTLEPDTSIEEQFKLSFSEGLMNTWGWGEKFKRVKAKLK